MQRSHKESTTIAEKRHSVNWGALGHPGWTRTPIVIWDMGKNVSQAGKGNFNPCPNSSLASQPTPVDGALLQRAGRVDVMRKGNFPFDSMKVQKKLLPINMN